MTSQYNLVYSDRTNIILSLLPTYDSYSLHDLDTISCKNVKIRSVCHSMSPFFRKLKSSSSRFCRWWFKFLNNISHSIENCIFLVRPFESRTRWDHHRHLHLVMFDLFDFAREYGLIVPDKDPIPHFNRYLGISEVVGSAAFMSSLASSFVSAVSCDRT